MNKNKDELLNEINQLIGTMISLRAVEDNTRSHWVNSHIEQISNLRNQLSNFELECETCQEMGGVYDEFATHLMDGICCPQCQGHGFKTEDLKRAFCALNAESENKSKTIFEKSEEILVNYILVDL